MELSGGALSLHLSKTVFFGWSVLFGCPVLFGWPVFLRASFSVKVTRHEKYTNTSRGIQMKTVISKIFVQLILDNLATLATTL